MKFSKINCLKEEKQGGSPDSFSKYWQYYPATNVVLTPIKTIFIINRNRMHTCIEYSNNTVYMCKSIITANKYFLYLSSP